MQAPPTQKTTSAHGADGRHDKSGGGNHQGSAASQIDFSNLPRDRAALIQMMEDAGIEYGSREYNQILKLQDQMLRQENVGTGDVRSGQKITKKIGKLGDRLDAGDPYSFGFAASGGGGGGAADEGGAGPGGDLSDIGDFLDNAVIPDWMRRSPEMGEAMFDWARFQQEQDNRQQAADIYGGLMDLYNEDPTRQAMYDFLGKGVQSTLTPEMIEQMKMAGRTQAGAGLTALDQRLRAAAGQAGIPTNNLSALMASGRSDILGQLLGNERQTDIDAAMMGAQDRDRYFSQLNAAQGSLLGPMAGVYGGLANLIAGGYAGANPMSGVADYRIAQQQLRQSDPNQAFHAQDWTGIGMQGLGGIASGLMGV